MFTVGFVFTQKSGKATIVLTNQKLKLLSTAIDRAVNNASKFPSNMEIVVVNPLGDIEYRMNGWAE